MALRQGMTQQIVEQPRPIQQGGTLGGWDTPSLRDPPPLNPKAPTVSPLPSQHVLLKNIFIFTGIHENSQSTG